MLVSGRVSIIYEVYLDFIWYYCVVISCNFFAFKAGAADDFPPTPKLGQVVDDLLAQPNNLSLELQGGSC